MAFSVKDRIEYAQSAQNCNLAQHLCDLKRPLLANAAFA